jgi:hypothetical protein
VKVSDHKSRFREAAIAHKTGTAEGKVRETNRAFDRMIAAVKAMRKGPDRGKGYLTELLFDPEVAVRSSAATYLLPLDEPAAVFVLEEVANGRHKFVSFTAEMVLREWRAGRLKLP